LEDLGFLHVPDGLTVQDCLLQLVRPRPIPVSSPQIVAAVKRWVQKTPRRQRFGAGGTFQLAGRRGVGRSESERTPSWSAGMKERSEVESDFVAVGHEWHPEHEPLALPTKRPTARRKT
jgi:hypothetical protein